MSKLDKYMMTGVIIVGMIAFFILGWGFSEQQWKHYAIIHHSAFYESDSWGNVTFHWNDDSFAQMPFQDGGWEKIQTSIFNQKLNALGIK
jgi:hypothetical protein